MATDSSRAILVVEDEAVIAMDLRRQLEAHGFQVVATVARAADVVPAVQLHRPAAVLMDIRLKGEMSGIPLAEEIFVCEDVPVVFLSAFGGPGIYERAARAGAYGYLTKPVTQAALIATIEMAVQKHADLRSRREDAQWLGVALNALEQAIVGLDADGCVRFMNHAAVKLTGWMLLEAKGSRPQWAQQLAELMATGTGYGPFTLVTRAGHSIALNARFFSVKTGGAVCALEESVGSTDGGSTDGGGAG